GGVGVVFVRGGGRPPAVSRAVVVGIGGGNGGPPTCPADCSAAGGATGGRGPATGVPHSLQKHAPGPSSVLHAAHFAVSRVPQPSQNLACSRLFGGTVGTASTG